MSGLTEPRRSPSRRASLNAFFYEREVPYGLAAVRMAICGVLFAVMLPRWFHAREFYSRDGAPAPLADGYGLPEMLPVFSGEVVVVLVTALVFCLFTAAIGWQTRLSLAIATLVYPYLNLLDSLSSLTKHSVIATHLLFLLTLSNCGAVWSVDAWLRRRHTTVTRSDLLSPLWPQRLMQLLIGIVYFGAAITKFQTPAYFNGDQLRQWMLSNYNHHNPLGEYLSLYPWTLIVMAYVAIVWELAFVFLCWSGWSRVWVLALGVCFHLGTTVSLGLYIFPAVMFSSYLAFFRERDFQRLWVWLRKGWPSRPLRAVQTRWRSIRHSSERSLLPTGPLPSALAFGLALVCTSAVGIAAEHWLDPYGLRRPEGPHRLRELTPEEIAALRQHDMPLAEADKFLSFDVGRHLFGGSILTRHSEFSSGETLIAQCTLNPPHEDLWVECLLTDAGGRLIDHKESVVERNSMRGTFTCRLDESLPAGSYQLILKSSGEEVARRRIEVR